MIYLYKRQILEKFHGRKLVVWKKHKIKGVFSALTPCVHYESIIHYLYFCISVRVFVCVAVSQLLEEMKVVLLVSVCSSVYSQQGEELEQLVLHLAQLCHWLR